MKQFLSFLLLFSGITGNVWANHACPSGFVDNTGFYNGTRTLILEPNAFEFDPYQTDLLKLQETLRNQGYAAQQNQNSFANLAGLLEGSTLFKIDDADNMISNAGDPVRILITFSHGSGNPYPALGYELYARTIAGEKKRDQRWIDLSYWYTQNTDIIKVSRSGSYPYYGIGIMPSFIKKVTKDKGIPAPDIVHIIGCNTANSDWDDLVSDAGVRCLAAMSDTLIYGVTNGVDMTCHPELLMPWRRMDGRGWDGQYNWNIPVAKRLRTAPLSFQELFLYNGQQRMVRFNPIRSLWDLTFATGIDSMALSPTLFNLTLQQNHSIGQVATGVTARFSCDMMQNYEAAMVYGTHGAYVSGEQWSDPQTLNFTVRSVRVYPWSDVILRGMNTPYRYLQSANGCRPICFSGHGPVGPYDHDSTIVVNTTYNDPNYAAAYDGVVAWKDGGSTQVWLTGTEVGTTRHVIMAGSDPDNLSEVGSIPGSGQAHYKVDKLVTVPGTFDYVEVKEEPDGSTSRVSDVLLEEPAIHKGYVHSSHAEVVRETMMDEDVAQRNRGGFARLDTPPTNEWIIYGPPNLVSYFQAHGGGSLLTRQGFTPVRKPSVHLCRSRLWTCRDFSVKWIRPRALRYVPGRRSEQAIGCGLG